MKKEKGKISTKRNKENSTTSKISLVDEMFGIPVVGIKYFVYPISKSGLLQWGNTSTEGTFKLVKSKLYTDKIFVRYFNASGIELFNSTVKINAKSIKVKMPFDKWKHFIRESREPEIKNINYYDEYLKINTVLKTVADKKGISIRKTANKTLQAAFELDFFLKIIKGVLTYKSGALNELIRVLTKRNNKNEKYLIDIIEKSKNQIRKLDSGIYEKGITSFAPGMSDFYFHILKLGKKHSGLGRNLLGIMFTLNRNVSPIIRNCRSMGSGTSLPENGYIDYEITDPYNDDWVPGKEDNPFHGGIQPGDLDPTDDFGHLTGEEKARFKCELALLENYDNETHGSDAVIAGGAPTITINSITPKSAPQPGEPDGKVIVLATTSNIGNNSIGDNLSVSFPIKGGRTEVNGLIVSINQLNDRDWQIRLEVYPPIRTVEGVVQVSGSPLECYSNTPISDPDVESFRRVEKDCLGRWQEPSIGIAQSASCSPTEINWLGSTPEIHFRWNKLNTDDKIYGDTWVCSGKGSSFVPVSKGKIKPNKTSSDKLDSLHGILKNSWLELKDSNTEAEENSSCKLRNESAFLLLEPDHALRFEVFTSNNPITNTSIFLSNLLPARNIGSADNIIRNSYYHINWESTEITWETIGQVAAHGSWIEVNNFPLDILCSAVESNMVLLVKATASNNFPGHGVRVLEVLVHNYSKILDFEITGTNGRVIDSDGTIGPDEIITVKFNASMPFCANRGVKLKASLFLGEQSIGEREITSSIFGTVSFDPITINLRNFSQEGKLAIKVDLKYSYLSGQLVTQGEFNGIGSLQNIIIAPRIVIFCFASQWSDVYKSDGAINNSGSGYNFAIKLIELICNRINGSSLHLKRSLVTGRVGQSHDPLGTIDGEFKQVNFPQTDINESGSIQIFASEWGFREGNNEWGRPQRDWNDEENASGVDFYLDQSKVIDLINPIIEGNRKTHFIFIGHSRGAGACFNIESWLKRTLPDGKREILAAVYFDAMHTDGIYQPVHSFALCANIMRHFYATQDSSILGQEVHVPIRNCLWDGTNHPTLGDCIGNPPHCDTGVFSQFAVNTNHGGVPKAGRLEVQNNGLLSNGDHLWEMIGNEMAEKIFSFYYELLSDH